MYGDTLHCLATWISSFARVLQTKHCLLGAAQHGRVACAQLPRQAGLTMFTCAIALFLKWHQRTTTTTPLSTSLSLPLCLLSAAGLFACHCTSLYNEHATAAEHLLWVE